jgi:hypothetical protein
MMRTKRSRRKVWINGHFVDNPKTDAWKKFLELTLPHQEPQIKGMSNVCVESWVALHGMNNEQEYDLETNDHLKS